jgi:uncharacterized membrane protein
MSSSKINPATATAASAAAVVISISPPDDALIAPPESLGSNIGREEGASINSDDSNDCNARYLNDAERVITFTDAVVAIAMTLLILPLMEASADFSEVGSVKGFFQQYWPNFLALWASFVVVWKAWRAHEYLFLRVAKFSERLHLLNFFWMFGIVIMPVLANLLYVDITAETKDVGGIKGISLYVLDVLFLRICELFIALAIRNDELTWKKHKKGLQLDFFVAAGIEIVFLALAAILSALYSVAFICVIFLDFPVMKFAEWMWPQIGHSERKHYHLLGAVLFEGLFFLIQWVRAQLQARRQT